MILHTLSSPAAFRDCVRFADASDMVLVMDDAVTCLLAHSASQSITDFPQQLFVCLSDLQLRGIEAQDLLASVEAGPDTLPVTLSEQADKVIHWG